MDISFIKGIIPPIVTPITSDEKIDEEALRRLVDFVIEGEAQVYSPLVPMASST